MMNTTIKPEAVEHLKNKLRFDYRTVRKAVVAEDVDNYTIAMLNRLNNTIEEARKMLDDLSRQLAEKK